MTITIREIGTVKEVQALRPVILEYFRIVTGELREHFGVELAAEGPVDDMLAKPEVFIPPKGRSFVADTADGHLVGTAFLRPMTGKSVEIKRLYVRPEARGTGLGRRLLHHAMDAARHMGADSMYLDTLKSLTAAIRLYESEGFETIDAYPGSDIAEYPDIVPCAKFMRKSL